MYVFFWLDISFASLSSNGFKEKTKENNYGFSLETPLSNN